MGAIYRLGNYPSPFGIGVEIVGKEVRPGEERPVKVDESHIGCRSNLPYGLLLLCMPVTCAALESVMPVHDGSHKAYPYPGGRIGLPVIINQRFVVRNEFFGIIGPVAGVGIIQAEVDNNEVCLVLQRLTVFGECGVRPVAMVKKSSPIVTEVPHLESTAKQCLKLCGIRIVIPVPNAVSVGDAVSYTGHLDRYLGIRKESCEHHADKGNQSIWHFHVNLINMGCLANIINCID